jgi:ribosomal-protein-alanine N-acetyltransferase
VVEFDASIQGFVVLCQVLDESSIHNIVVHPAQRRRGLGKMLLEAGLEWARCNAAARCCLEVRASNTVALELYEQYGFKRDGMRKNYYATASGREDALLMSIGLAEQGC